MTAGENKYAKLGLFYDVENPNLGDQAREMGAALLPVALGEEIEVFDVGCGMDHTWCVPFSQ